MVELTRQSSSSTHNTLITSYGAMMSVTNYLTLLDRIKLQALCKKFYNSLIPQIIHEIEIPNVTLVLESSRKDIQIGMWKKGAKKLKVRKLLKIGSGEYDDSPDVLGFSEIYFQWLIPIDSYNFLAFPMKNEALLKNGFLLAFGTNFKLKSSKPIAPMPDDAMRPTAVLWKNPNDENKGVKLLMIGGRVDRNSQMYDLQSDTWQMTPRLPISHNITTNVCVNFREQAVFTFMVDSKLTIKSAVLDLTEAKFTDIEVENTDEMNWVF